MSKMDPKVLENSKSDERGASLVEYALLVALIAVIAIIAIRGLGRQVSSSFSGIQSGMSSAN